MSGFPRLCRITDVSEEEVAAPVAVKLSTETHVFLIIHIKQGSGVILVVYSFI